MNITTVEQASWYLSALIDGEGYVSKGKDSAKVCIFNTELSIINAARASLEILEIPYKVYSKRATTSTKTCWNVYIGSLDDVKKLAGVVHLQSEAKAERLKAIVQYRRRRLRLSDRPIDEIRRLYLDEKLPVVEISVIVGWKPQTVWKWLREAGLSRTHSEAGLLRGQRKNA